VNPGTELLLFAGIMVLGQFSPGPDMLLLTRTALRHGPGAGARMACGIACGLALHATLAILGMSWALRRNELVWDMLRFAAAGYLAWLAYGLLRRFHMPQDDAGTHADTASAPFLRGLACNLTNLKAALFLTAVASPFLAGERPAWWGAALWGIIVFQALALWSLWALLLQWRPLKSFYQKYGRWIDAAFAIGLLALAVRLIVH
jgi:threonine efflux protein